MPMNPVSELRKADALSRQGHHEQAGELYRAVLDKFPQREDAGRGLLASLEARQDWAALETAATLLTTRLPQFAGAWLALARVQLSMHKDALTACQRCVKLDPRNPVAHDYLGVAYRRAGRFEEAVDALRASLTLRPGHISTRSNLANALRGAGRLREALRLYDEVLAVEPGRLEALYNRCLALVDLGSLAEAEAQLGRLIVKAPDLADAHNALGSVLQKMQRLAAAEPCFRTALALRPDLPEAVANLALVLHGLGKLDEMRPYLARAIELNPHSSRLRLVALVASLPKLVRDTDEAEALLHRFDTGLDAYAGWREQALREGRLQQDTVSYLPFDLAYRQGNQKDRLARFSDLCLLGREGRPPRPAAACVPGTPLRLGIVSAHIRRHSVWDIVLKGLIEHLDPAVFELTIYHLGHIEDEQTRYARQRALHWRDASALEEAGGWPALITADAQDVLFFPELGMDAATYALAQQRLAPLQAAGWGHPITTGIATIDLFLSAELLEPVDAQQHYREQLVLLPGTGCCTLPYEVEARPNPALQALLAQTSAPSFLIPQSVVKFDPRFDTVYAEIARRVGAGRFIIPVADHMQEPGALLAARLSDAFRHAGLDPAAHLSFIPWLSEGEFRYALQACTVFLDCPSFSGYTTAWKALRGGIPIVTCQGPFMRQRLAAGLLIKAGLEELVTQSLDEYVELAASLALEAEPDRLARRRRIAGLSSRADHDISVVRAFERELRSRARRFAEPASTGDVGLA